MVRGPLSEYENQEIVNCFLGHTYCMSYRTGPVCACTVFQRDTITNCKNMASYSTLNNETLTGVAAKLGTDWKAMAAMKQNKARYGALKGSTKFQRNTLLAIPKAYSKWKMKQLLPAVEEEREECVDCGVEDNPAQMLLCDGCDACHHVACVGLAAVPSGDWFCSSCLDILRARKAHNQSDHGVQRLPYRGGKYFVLFRGRRTAKAAPVTKVSRRRQFNHNRVQGTTQHDRYLSNNDED